MGDVDPRAGLSIICVFNKPLTREECLDASIAAHTGSAEVEFLPVDNTAGQFASAGAALNHGARLASYDVVVFVHQDVYLHSLDRLLAVGQHLRGDTWGILGSCGITADGRIIGRLRDRVQLIGEDAEAPVPVDSLDEVLFLIHRQRVLAEPLTEEPELSWHAYAVEYSARMREQGLGAGAVNTAISHNSLTVNTVGLKTAHHRVGSLHPRSLPLRTTCGTVESGAPGWRESKPVRAPRALARLLGSEVEARRATRRTTLRFVHTDIRLDVDLLRHRPGSPLHVLNLDTGGGFARHVPDQLALTRYGHPVLFRASPDLAGVTALLTEVPADRTVLVSNLTLDDVAGLADERHDWLAGLHDGTYWLLAGPSTPPESWTTAHAPLRQALAGVLPGS